MKPIRKLTFVGTLAIFLFAACTFTNRLHSQQNPLQGPADPSPLYVATFIDLMPPSSAAGTAAIRQYVQGTRKEQGLVSCEAIAQIAGRANHLVVLEVWKDRAAFEKHQSAAVR